MPEDTDRLFDAARWMQRAACRDADTNLFFPRRGESPKPAQAICAGCSVKAECKEFGKDDRHGIYGGEVPYVRLRRGQRDHRVRV